MNPDIGSPDIVSDIDTDIGNLMPDIEVLLLYRSTSDIGFNIGGIVLQYRSLPDIGVSDHDIGSQNYDIGVFPISGAPISGKTPVSKKLRYRRWQESRWEETALSEEKYCALEQVKRAVETRWHRKADRAA